MIVWWGSDEVMRGKWWFVSKRFFFLFVLSASVRSSRGVGGDSILAGEKQETEMYV